MKDLTKIEETILIAIWRLGEDTYGVRIKNHIKKATGKDYLYSTLYTTFEQLVRKGYVTKQFGAPTAVRGGKRKVFFCITDEGTEALKHAFEKQKAVWRGITEESFDTGLIS